MSPAPLTVHNAEITTAAVEVKTLTIKGKQVTLAVFRQIQAEDLFTRDLSYRGNPWGRVNYHVGCEQVSAVHWHVVWQRDVELRRAVVIYPGDSPPSPNVDEWASLAARYLAAHPEAQDSPDAALNALGKPETRPGTFPRFCAHLDGARVWVSWERDHEIERRAEKVRRGYEEAPPLEDVQNAWDACLRRHDANRTTWTQRRERWREIESLPQLFIAV